MIIRWVARIVVALVLLLALGLALGWWLLSGSTATLDGRLRTGVAHPVSIQRDALGVADVRAQDRDDLAFATGFVHAQERFFQMDLLRRNAAGELAALFGPAALEVDLDHRRHRFRAGAKIAVARLPRADRALLAAYTRGVNAGLHALRVRPWEYLLLRARPAPWRAEDSFLVIDAMFLDLNQGGTDTRELALARMRAALPDAVVDFLTAADGTWEAPLLGGSSPVPAIPPPGVLDLRHAPAPAVSVALVDVTRAGSNNFAVSGALTGAGAILANDMHLGLGVPNIWFRMRLRYPDLDGSARDHGAPDGAGVIDLNGLTLPGVPALVAGSNGHIAWGYTNSYGDWMDWVRVRRDPGDPQRYRVPHGWERIKVHREAIAVKGASPHVLEVEQTRWGPIMAVDTDGTSLALRWIAHLPRTHNLNLLRLEHVRNVHQALAIAPGIGMPPQNFLVADAAGNIGWTLTGNALPLRQGLDPQLPVDGADPRAAWAAFAAPAQFPRIENPSDGRLWTANNRTMTGPWLTAEGDSGYAVGARARQIRDDLFSRRHFVPADMLAIQLDDRARFLAPWQKLLLATLQGMPRTHRLSRVRARVRDWGARAATDSVGYRLVRAFRVQVHEAVLAPFIARIKMRFPDFQWPGTENADAAVAALLQARPPHLLDPRYRSWDALLQDAARKVLAVPDGSSPDDRRHDPASRTWGERNTASIRHPLSRALPAWIARYLDMPHDELPGDSHMPRVQASDFGASERFGIMPGDEAHSYLHMPGGQSDNPLSPFYGAGHEDWVHGRATPLLPGPPQHALMLVPH